MLVGETSTDLLRDIAGQAEDDALTFLVARATKRGDRALARDLAAVPPRSDEGSTVLVGADCPALARIAGVCDPVETLAWRRAIVHAGVRDDRRRVRLLLDLAARRCAS